VGSKKILFGSDMPYFETRSTIGRIAMGKISEDEKKDILGLNMKRILKI
jgi:predicted TIM-barrel fold metal-dependent hydrolase